MSSPATDCRVLRVGCITIEVPSPLRYRCTYVMVFLDSKQCLTSPAHRLFHN